MFRLVGTKERVPVSLACAVLRLQISVSLTIPRRRESRGVVNGHLLEMLVCVCVCCNIPCIHLARGYTVTHLLGVLLEMALLETVS